MPFVAQVFRGSKQIIFPEKIAEPKSASWVWVKSRDQLYRQFKVYEGFNLVSILFDMDSIWFHHKFDQFVIIKLKICVHWYRMVPHSMVCPPVSVVHIVHVVLRCSELPSGCRTPTPPILVSGYPYAESTDSQDGPRLTDSTIFHVGHIEPRCLLLSIVVPCCLFLLWFSPAF